MSKEKPSNRPAASPWGTQEPVEGEWYIIELRLPPPDTCCVSYSLHTAPFPHNEHYIPLRWARVNLPQLAKENE